MFLGPQPKARATNTKTTLLAVLVIFLLHRAWVYHDRFSFETVTVLGNQVLRIPDKAPASAIPKKIWYKLGPKGMSDAAKAWTGSCISQNPDYSYEFLTDASAEAYVKKTFAASRPDIVEVYTQLTVPILKADLLRYLLLYSEGGVWSDLDVSCEGLPIPAWTPPEYRGAADLVVGYEFDAGYSDYYFHQFATWTILARPGVRHLLAVVNDIVEAVHAAQAAAGVARIADLDMTTVGDVIDLTGPRRFTTSVLRSVGEALGAVVDRYDIEQIRDPILLDNVLVLPGNAFANLTNHFEELGEPSVPVMVTHHYAGSWKNDFGGESLDARSKPQPKRMR